MSLLGAEDLARFLEEHPGWSGSGKEIRRTYQFEDFNESMGFVTRVALAAEKANHHPDIDIRWNKVTLTLSTHSEGGVTQKDTAAASVFDAASHNP